MSAVHKRPRHEPAHAASMMSHWRPENSADPCCGLSRWVQLMPLPGSPTVVRVPVLPNDTCAPRTPIEVEIPREK